MAYMIMLVVREASSLEAVLDAWEAMQINQVTFMESVCSHRERAEPPHIPMRFLFEGVGGAQEHCSFTLFAVVPDDKVVRACIAEAEAVLGDFGAAGRAMLAAWPVPIVRGYSGRVEGEEPGR